MSAPPLDKLRFPCPHCGRALAAPAALLGTEQPCPGCKRFVYVPQVAPAAANAQPKIPAAPPVQNGPPARATAARAAPADEDEFALGAPGEAAAPQQQIYVPVLCRICDTRMYATLDQVGTEIKCPDCGARTKVSEPRGKPVAAPPVSVALDGYELSEPPVQLTLELVGYGLGPGSFMSAVANVRSAPDSARRAPRPTRWWFIAGLVSWKCVYSVMGSILWSAALAIAAVYLIALVNFLSDEMLTAIAAVIATAVASVVTLAALVYLFSALLATLEVASAGAADIGPELEVGLIERVFHSMFLAAAILYAALPGAVVDIVAGQPAAWQLPLAVAPALHLAPLVSLLLLLPIVQLSVLEAASLVVPVSSVIARSLVKVPGAWCVFYLCASLLTFVTGAGLLALLSFPGPVAYFLCFLFVFSMLALYYRLLGRLAWYCAARLAQRPVAQSADSLEL